MKRAKSILFQSILLILFASPSVLFAKGAGTSGGLTLLEPFGARTAALGEAFTAVSNDIAAFGYNPASFTRLRGSTTPGARGAGRPEAAERL